MSHHITANGQTVGVGFKTERLDELVTHNGGATNNVVPQKVHTQAAQCYKEGHSGVTIIKSRRLAFRGDDF